MAKANKNSLIKFLIFLLIFLVIFVFFLFFLIGPKIKEYRAKKSAYEAYLQQNQVLLQEQQTLSNKIEELKTKKQKIISAFENDFNEIEFINFAKEFFDNVKLVKNDFYSDEYGFSVYQFSATSNTKTPVKFYQFIDKLQAYHNIIKIDFPIVLESKENTLNINFILNIYKLR